MNVFIFVGSSVWFVYVSLILMNVLMRLVFFSNCMSVFDVSLVWMSVFGMMLMLKLCIIILWLNMGLFDEMLKWNGMVSMLLLIWNDSVGWCSDGEIGMNVWLVRLVGVLGCVCVCRYVGVVMIMIGMCLISCMMVDLFVSMYGMMMLML